MEASDLGVVDEEQEKTPSSTLVPLAALPLRAEGRYLVGASGARVRLYCVNWYGAHMQQMVVAGLEYLTPKEVAERIASLRFNCVRLPYSLDLLMSNTTAVPYPKATLAANPELQAKSPLEVFDATVEALTAEGLLVILNNHVSSKMWCCSPWDGEGLWRTENYPEEMWLSGLQLAAARYADNVRVAGFDLRNEPRRSSLGYPGWGAGSAGTADDWSRAAGSGGKLVAEVNQNMLVIVSAVNFPMMLCDVGQNMLHASVPELQGRVVYTVHEYPWWSFDLMTHVALGRLLPYLGVLAVVALLTLAFAPRAKLHCRSRLFLVSTSFAAICTALLFAVVAYSKVIIMQQTCSPSSFYGSLFFLLAPCLMAWVAGLAWTGIVGILLWHGFCFRSLVFRGARAASMPDSSRVALTPEDCEQGQRTVARRSRTLSLRRQVGVAICIGSVMLFLELIRENTAEYDSFKADLDRRWGFILRGETAAPVWIGEFGTNTDNLWWQYFRRYLVEEDLDWSYWAFNGERAPHQQERYGLLKDDWKTVRDDWKLEHLQMLIDAGEKSKGRRSNASDLLPQWVI